MNESKMTRITSGMPIDDDYVLINGVKYKRVEETQPKTLYNILRELDKPMFTDDVCSAVKRWMSQYTCDYIMNDEYLKGYNECLLVLTENLK